MAARAAGRTSEGSTNAFANARTDVRAEAHAAVRSEAHHDARQDATAQMHAHAHAHAVTRLHGRHGTGATPHGGNPWRAKYLTALRVQPPPSPVTRQSAGGAATAAPSSRVPSQTDTRPPIDDADAAAASSFQGTPPMARSAGTRRSMPHSLPSQSLLASGDALTHTHTDAHGDAWMAAPGSRAADISAQILAAAQAVPPPGAAPSEPRGRSVSLEARTHVHTHTHTHTHTHARAVADAYAPDAPHASVPIAIPAGHAPIAIPARPGRPSLRAASEVSDGSSDVYMGEARSEAWRGSDTGPDALGDQASAGDDDVFGYGHDLDSSLPPRRAVVRGVRGRSVSSDSSSTRPSASAPALASPFATPPFGVPQDAHLPSPLMASMSSMAIGRVAASSSAATGMPALELKQDAARWDTLAFSARMDPAVLALQRDAVADDTDSASHSSAGKRRQPDAGASAADTDSVAASEEVPSTTGKGGPHESTETAGVFLDAMSLPRSAGRRSSGSAGSGRQRRRVTVNTAVDIIAPGIPPVSPISGASSYSSLPSVMGRGMPTSRRAPPPPQVITAVRDEVHGGGIRIVGGVALPVSAPPVVASRVQESLEDDDAEDELDDGGAGEEEDEDENQDEEDADTETVGSLPAIGPAGAPAMQRALRHHSYAMKQKPAPVAIAAPRGGGHAAPPARAAKHAAPSAADMALSSSFVPPHLLAQAAASQDDVFSLGMHHQFKLRPTNRM